MHPVLALALVAFTLSCWGICSNFALRRPQIHPRDRRRHRVVLRGLHHHRRAGAPVYNAKINVHIAYGFGSFHKLDLEVSTNADGKARFIGLPNRLKRALTFYATEVRSRSPSHRRSRENLQSAIHDGLAKEMTT